MQNLHRHSCYSNIFTPDSAAKNEEYAKRAVELGHKVLVSVEHGWQGYYYETFELAHKYDLKCVIGAEAYWVKDRKTTDKSNHHILILAKNNTGREALNDALSEANITGYYYKPRLDLELILGLPPDDVMVTTACVAFNGYEDVDDCILKFRDHFKENFFLEIQYHNTESQKKWNTHLKEMSSKYEIPLIVGLDSHYIYPQESAQRDLILEAKKIHYDDEDGWYMDYPDDNEVVRRFIEQGIFNEAEVLEAMQNTDRSLEFGDYDDVSIFSKDIKLPTLYPGETKEQKDKRYSQLISKKFSEYCKGFDKENYDKYFEGVKNEVQTYKDTGMCDYPLLDYAIVKDAVGHGGLITSSGRGSAVSFFTNTLCGFSNVDRFKSAIKLYPERFISTTRILETKSLPDIDLNVGTPEIFEESQARVLGEDHVAPMIAFGTFKKKSSFKLYARAKNMDFTLANEISTQIEKYEFALKNADDEDKDSINIYDFVDKKYWSYLDESKEYWGIISDKKKAPSAYLLYQGNIRKEIGLIKCKSESTKKEYITCVIDGAIAESYKFLKNDILKVDSVLLIKKVFDRIGIPQFDTNELTKRTNGDSKVWNIYGNGYTVGVNQVEKDSTTKRCTVYKPKNLSELSAFIAAIRPGFKSMYKVFEAREEFSYGIKAVDDILQTKELPVSFMIYQEQVMAILHYAGFPMDQCYGAIKAIAKKHPEKVKPLKEQFLKNFRKKLIEEENLSEKDARTNADKIWKIVEDNCFYSFNASHAFCMALDSLYQAWQKAYYPYEFYEVLLQHYSDKGNKDKVTELKKEMRTAFGIQEGEFKFGVDNTKFTADKDNECIYPCLSSIKNISNTVAKELLKLSKNDNIKTFVDLLDALQNTHVNSRQLEILTRLGYFDNFYNPAKNLKIAEMYNLLKDRKELSLDKLDEYNLPLYLVEKHAGKITAKTAKDFDWRALLNDWIEVTDFGNSPKIDQLRAEHEFLGYINTILPNVNTGYYLVTDMSGDKSKRVKLHQLSTGNEIKVKCRGNVFSQNPFEIDDVLMIYDIHGEKKWGKDENDEWIRTNEYEDILANYKIINKKEKKNEGLL